MDKHSYIHVTKVFLDICITYVCEGGFVGVCVGGGGGGDLILKTYLFT